MSTIKGKKVKITAKGDLQGAIGTVRYVGPLDDKKGEGDYVGVQLDKPLGKNNGTLGSKEYFKAKQKHGAFIKPNYLVLPNGTSIANLLPKGGSAPHTGASKLSKQLVQMENEQNQELKKQLEEANMKIKELEQTDSMKEVIELKQKVKDLEQSNRTLKMENQKVKYAVKEQDDDKLKDLNEKIEFFKSQKEAIEKEKVDLKKKNAQLSAELEEYAENLDMVEQLTIKIQNLQAKNEKLKQDLQAANAQLKNVKMMGQSSASSEELGENIKILNETVALLQSDLKEEKQKNTELTDQMGKIQASQGQSKKLEIKLKQKTEQIEQLTLELEACSDAATYAEKLTLDNLKKDEQIKDKTVKINEYLSQVQTLQNQLVMNKQFQDQLNTQLLNQQQLMDKLTQEIEQKNSYIAELTRQVEKYKKKLFEFTSQNSELMMGSNITVGEDISKEEQMIPKDFMNVDQYQHKYYNSLKVQQSINQKLLTKQLEFSKVRNDVGVYMLNLSQSLPEEFTAQFYPEVVQMLTQIKIANDKLYYIFEICSLTFKNKSEIYSKENEQLAQWLILVMKEVSMLYSSLHKLEITLTIAENEDQLSQVLVHRVLGETVRKIDNFASEILHRFAQDNISASIDIQPFQEPIETLDEINIAVKRTFTKEHQVKMRLCFEAMETITKTYEMIINYKQTSELGQNAEVDNLLENLIKSVIEYLTECCLNPHIRYKAEMISYLEGIDIISNIFNDIRLQGNFQELGNLYSDSENIKMLKETILTTQFHVKELLKDLEDIVYPSELSKIQTQLPGKVWQQKLKAMKDQLLKVKDTLEQKLELQQQLNEGKKKILLLERDLKDKQSSKELYEKRIGQLQLKVEQANTIENQNKRNVEKIKSLEEANKILEQQMLDQSKKRKLLEEELKKIKDKYEYLQTDMMMRNKRNKNTSIQGLNSEDVANLAIFKNAIKQSNNMRTLEIKKKMMQLKLSPIYLMNSKEEEPKVEDAGQEEKSQELLKSQTNAVRRNVMNQLSQLQIINPLDQKTSRQSTQFNIDKILQDINNVSIQKIKQGQKKQKEKEHIFDIGQLILPHSNQTKQRSIKLIEGSVGYTSN